MLAAAALSHYDGVGPGEAVGSEHALTSPPGLMFQAPSQAPGGISGKVPNICTVLSVR